MKFNLTQYLEELRPLINVDCGTYTLEGIECVASQFEQKFQAMAGWNVKRVDCAKAGFGLEIRNKPDTEQIDVMLVGHLDTVFAKDTAAQRPMSYDNEKAYGPGVADMKSGLLNIVYALRHLEPTLIDKCSICVCMNPDEEVGSADSVAWLQSVAKHAKYALVIEAARADGGLVKARKGRACYQLNFHGVAAHAGNEPQNGRSAITELAHWVVAINAMTNFDSGTTLNVGIVSGGTNSNTVAEYADAAVEVRFWSNEEYQQVDAALKRMQANPFIDGVSVALEREMYKPSMMPSERTESLMQLVETLAQELEIDIKWHSVGGGSDANHMAILGIPTLDGLGAIGGHFHSDKEYLLLESIEPRIRLLTRILQHLVA
ncbi:Carboxypeptidase G2 [Enterobacterales bacterium 8AC]|nr:Carboxypeptidase G2 [Enterobacterales bacterium 8AC]